MRYLARIIHFISICLFVLGLNTAWAQSILSYDLTEDNKLSITDVQCLVNIILGNSSNSAGDLNNDGFINISDLQVLINRILGKDIAGSKNITIQWQTTDNEDITGFRVYLEGIEVTTITDPSRRETSFLCNIHNGINTFSMTSLSANDESDYSDPFAVIYPE